MSGNSGLSAQIRSELVKIRSVRSLTILPVVMTVLVPAMALFVGVTGSLDPDDTVFGGALTGGILGLAVAGIWGALVVTGEYSSGTIEPVLTVTPLRGRVLAAKAVVVGVAAILLAIPACAAAFGIGLVTLDGHVTGDPVPALLGIALAYGAVGVLGVACGTVLRSSAGAVAVVLGVLILPELIGPLLGSLQPWITGAAPSAVVVKLSQSADAAPEVMGSWGGWVSLMILVSYTAVVAVAARAVFVARDA
ncbi:ABC transporter permease subunit [Rhodococcus triatomae]|uniref:ABC-2 family transporter protein n=1 Tax=Rhodococcus triatomae TaxID=300028 RepID=A0A1G8QP01_9NOCA|nr:ABC transporter permease subunit [Rhodococcus triatomae]QNG20622.1 ABC transporter permease subunit [Rhodococcus triatomae]QNG23460.1 ABC transporter permease subunit [Rhodococcus triatomae]SDJ06085.1 ABC-2 family transporter protein [Rhodococcus triatomae]